VAITRFEHGRGTAVRPPRHNASYQNPEHAERILRVLAIPAKRCGRALVSFLDRPEIEAILAAPDRSTFIGRRDHALLTLAAQTGLRLSELIGLRRADLHLATGAHVRCEGKGRKQRTTPLGRLSHVDQNYVRAETLRAANARLIDAQADIGLAQQWGGGLLASADGMRFVVPVATDNAGANPRYFGRGRGLTWLNYLNDQVAGLGGVVVPGTVRDSLHILDGLVGGPKPSP